MISYIIVIMMAIVICAKDTVPVSLVKNKSWAGLQEELACSGSRLLLFVEMCQRFCDSFHYY